ncbi:TIGR02444 family protein [Parvularcula sp. LCG005]|uniref:TIGR02444 family protein n=1 Tax=Parvularcula sp. LCG005 TaxID=3078805 RepID=UPI002942A072|nr:TIGR02444 family protein [Parvularcula sp. LCG005]WOI54548.1 TIGR02444 family protein [Parvularcula sp. LCG005]
MTSSEMTGIKLEGAAEDFWNWSIDVYEREGVKAPLLLLQDRYGYNVNNVLWTMWSALRGYSLSNDDVHDILESVADMQAHTVRQLREIRRFLTVPKAGFRTEELHGLRRRVLMVELEGEKLVQSRLAGFTADRSGTSENGNVAETARRYFGVCADRLENPIILADDLGDEAPQRLFDMIWDIASMEKNA